MGHHPVSAARNLGFIRSPGNRTAFALWLIFVDDDAVFIGVGVVVLLIFSETTSTFIFFNSLCWCLGPG
jgi:hypothetical protein